jgi:hypothetical protein
MPKLETLKNNATDPIATIIGTAGYIAAKFDLPSQIGLSVDAFAEVVFGVITIAAAIRSIVIGLKQTKTTEADA